MNYKDVLKTLNNSSINIEIEDLNVSEMIAFAQSKERLPELHSTYQLISPKNSKLKSYYHFMNLQSALDKDCKDDPSLLSQLSKLFVNYYINFGKKYLLISELRYPDAKKGEITGALDVASTEFSIEKETIFDNESTDTTTEYLNIINISKNTEGDFIIFMKETIGTYSLVTPSDLFLSEAGKQTREQLFLKKRTIKPGIHKLVVTKDLGCIIYLIDPNTLNRNETSADKAAMCNYILLKFLKKSDQIAEFALKPVYFFEAIQKLWDDKNVGIATEGYFQTSAGANFASSSKTKGSDLRDDPFQLGGQEADPGKLNFSKLRITWDSSNLPRIFLNGSSEMFTTPKQSLPFVKTTFIPDNAGKPCDFLDKVFEYATW